MKVYRLLASLPQDVQAALLFLLIGGLLLLRVYYLHRQRQSLLAHGTEALATVVWLEEDPHTGHHGSYHPVLRFQTAGQQTITDCYYYSKPRGRFTAGEQLPIHYHTAAPAEFRVLSYVRAEMRTYGLLGLLVAGLSLLKILAYAL